MPPGLYAVFACNSSHTSLDASQLTRPGPGFGSNLVYLPGVLKLKDILDILPMEDIVVSLLVSGVGDANSSLVGGHAWKSWWS